MLITINRNRVVVVFIEALVLLVIFLLFANTGLSTQMESFRNGKLPSYQHVDFQFKISLFRILIYVISPIISFMTYNHTLTKSIRFNHIKIGYFYETLFLSIAIIIALYVTLGLDVMLNRSIFNYSEIYIPVVGLVLEKVLNQKLGN